MIKFFKKYFYRYRRCQVCGDYFHKSTVPHVLLGAINAPERGFFPAYTCVHCLHLWQRGEQISIKYNQDTML